MVAPAVQLIDDDANHLRGVAVKFPVELHLPPGFRPDDLATWPHVEGRLEFVEGRLLFMPPCGDRQQDVTAWIVHLLCAWVEGHPEFVVAGNEAGMMFGKDVRGADAAVWRRADLGEYTGGVRIVPPLLAVEVAGRDEGEARLRDKARWYLDHGVTIVWLVLPLSREVVVVTVEGDTRCAGGARLPEHPALPELRIEVARVFAQLARGDTR